MPVPAGTIIRHARRSDVPVILEMIKELALYENEPDAVEATVEQLENTIAFAPSPDIEAGSTTPSTGDALTPTRPARALLIFTPSGFPAGLALYFYNYSTWRARGGIYLEDLFVRESERGKGFGQRLLAELAREVVSMKGGRLDWSVLKWNEPSIRFYLGEAVGATRMEEWVGMRVDGEALVRLAGKAE